MPKLKLKGITFTQQQIVELFKCAPHRDACDFKENSHQTIPALIEKGVLEKGTYENGTEYYIPTDKGWEIIKEYKPRGKA